ncbi:MAG: ribosomal-protein-alanine N-acetyltransferase [Gammaproteobacteria bacterium]|nr:MAG: ribosomal-protein-alanine N-acetyltransferase [Gammaproteobacteria bacterium]
MNSLTFHQITTADVKQLMPIENNCHSHPWSEKTFKSCINGRYFSEYALDKKQLKIGFYVGEHVAGEATLMDICVEPSLQGKGYGKALLLQFLQQVKTLNASKVFLEVRASNIAAQMLYMNHNFIEISRRTAYYPSAKGFGYEDAIVMSLTL